MSRLGRLNPHSTTLFVCDIQERFRQLISYMPSVIRAASIMLKTAEHLEIPVVITEHYPKAFGRTVSEFNFPNEYQSSPNLKDGYAITPQQMLFEKTKFSMLTDSVKNHIQQNQQLKSVILCGIEAHVCIQQTALDLLDIGIDVHILADGVSSINASDRNIAFDRLRHAGAFITTSESSVFELLHDATNPKFKQVSALLREPREDVGPFS